MSVGPRAVASEPPDPKVRDLAAVRRVGDERAYLYRLIETIGSGPDLEAILAGVTRLVTEATACHACLIWFEQDGRLVLRSSSAPYTHLAGKVSMAIDEGLAGWVYRTRRSTFIEQNALDDPRVKYFAELEEERFQSLVAVPVFGRSGDAIGVIALHAEAPREFDRADLDFLEHTAALIAGAIENARLYEDATARVQLLTDLSRLLQKIAQAGDQDRLLEVVVSGLRQLTGATRVEVHLFGPDERLRVEVARPRRASGLPVDERALRAGSTPGSTEEEEGRRLVRALWPDEPPGWPLVESLVAGDERLGLLVALVPTSAAAGLRAAVAGVAAHTAVALKQHQVIERLLEKTLLKDFFRSLSSVDGMPEETAELAARLHCDLEAPHLVVHVVPWHGASPAEGRGRSGQARRWRERAVQVESRLATRFPGLLVDTLEDALRALIPLRDDVDVDAVAMIRAIEWGPPEEEGFTIGVSNVCVGGSSYPHGFDEAERAAEVGGLIRRGPGVMTYSDLGPYRYALLAEPDDRDPFQRALDTLATYDRRRGTELLDTLEAYLGRRGNVVGTSRDLYIHPNTLRQRLDRIQRLSGVDLERDDWLSLAVATKIVKLRRMRATAGNGRGNDG